MSQLSFSEIMLEKKIIKETLTCTSSFLGDHLRMHVGVPQSYFISILVLTTFSISFFIRYVFLNYSCIHPKLFNKALSEIITTIGFFSYVIC